MDSALYNASFDLYKSQVQKQSRTHFPLKMSRLTCKVTSQLQNK